MSEQHPFIAFLIGLAEREDRASLAILRRGLAEKPGNDFAMYPLVALWFGSSSGREEEDLYFLIASLFAYHPQTGGNGNLGASFAAVRRAMDDDSAIEHRFSQLLTTNREDLPFVLRQSISFLAAKETPVDWQQLFTDLRYWDSPQKNVQRRWARSFWGYQKDSNRLLDTSGMPPT